jgi:hypothetical protein
VIGVCIHCPSCALGKTTGDWCTRHNRELSVIEDEYFPYIGRPDTLTCEGCGIILRKANLKAGSKEE